MFLITNKKAVLSARRAEREETKMIKRNVCGSDQKQLQIVLEIKLKELHKKQAKAIACEDWKSAEWFAEDIRYYSKKLHNIKNGFIFE